MKTGKHTAKEILEAVGVTADILGKVKVRIGGIRGIVTPEHVINVLNSGTLDILVGDKTYQLVIE